jgi:hypothetical protein
MCIRFLLFLKKCRIFFMQTLLYTRVHEAELDQAEQNEQYLKS